MIKMGNIHATAQNRIFPVLRHFIPTGDLSLVMFKLTIFIILFPTHGLMNSSKLVTGHFDMSDPFLSCRHTEQQDKKRADYNNQLSSSIKQT